MSNAIRLTPSPRERVWGKTSLAPWFPDSETPIGEIWFLGERELPLLVKLIFTSERLSVQVHPDDGEDGPRGKTEMWHIVEAAPGASLALGFREPLSRERLREAARSGEIEHLVNWMPACAGQTFFTPAHTVHAIGAGLVLWEIQQNCDVTYRLWDYGRPRPIHLEQAVAIADLGVHAGPARPARLDENRDELVRSRHFVTELVRMDAGASHTAEARACQIWICLQGQGDIGGDRFRPGEVWLFPDSGEQPRIAPATAARWLRTYVPA
jgi:mannose-6-phosphate isomerase